MCFYSAFKQRILICMCTWTFGTHTMLTETNKIINFQVCFFYSMFLCWITNLLYTITFSISKFFTWVKINQWNNQTWNTKPIPVIKLFILINKVAYGYNSSVFASLFLSGRFYTNECVYLNMDCVCSIDNWLCILIFDNW